MASSKSPWLSRIRKLSSRQTRTDKKTNFEAMSKVFCCCAALILCLLLTMSFSKFRITTTVRIGNPTRTELPSVSLCYFYRIDDLQMVMTNGLNRSTLTLKEINNQLLSWENFVQTCEVLDSNYSSKSCTDLDGPPREYLSIYTKCFTLFQFLDESIEYEREKIGSRFMIDIAMNVSNISTKKIGIFLTHKAAQITDSLGDPSFLQFDMENYNQAVISFDRTIITRLAPPYESRCFDYSKSGCEMYRTCITRCINRKSFQIHGAWNMQRYVPVNENFHGGRYSPQDDPRIIEACTEDFQASPCHDYLYQVVKSSMYL